MEWIDPVLGHLDEHKQCTYCNGFYGSCHGQPVCSTCHLFLFAIEPGEFERVPASEEDDARDEQQSLDSGNEEPTDPDLVEESSGEMGDERPSYMGNGINSRGRSRDFVVTNSSLEHVNPGDVLAAPNPQDQLNKRVRALSQYKPLSSLSPSSTAVVTRTNFESSGLNQSPLTCSRTTNNFSGSNNTSHEISSLSSLPSAPSQNFLVNPLNNLSLSSSSTFNNCLPAAPVTSRVPEEIFVCKIFPLLDDMQLFMCSRVCRRWRRIVLSLDLPWERFVRNRWPMFFPQFAITDWYETYSRLMDSMCCHRCFWSISHFTQNRNRRRRSLTSILPSSAVATERRNSSRITATMGSSEQREPMGGRMNQFTAAGIYPQVGVGVHLAVRGTDAVLTATSRGWSVPNAVNNQSAAGAALQVRGVGVAGPPVGFGDARFNILGGGGAPGMHNEVGEGGGVGDDRGDCWRNRRLQSEFHNLKHDPFLGLNAVKLDPAGYTWQASVEGPMGSPYEGGIFFIFMFIPENYPLKAPTVRFQTKILHPNISVHGDIGMESIGGVNWIPTLTLSKVLLSILSLLTDPNCEISMNAEAAFLYRSDRNRFNRMAKLTTYKYAMIDYMQCSSYLHQQQQMIPRGIHPPRLHLGASVAATAASQSLAGSTSVINTQYPNSSSLFYSECASPHEEFSSLPRANESQEVMDDRSDQNIRHQTSAASNTSNRRKNDRNGRSGHRNYNSSNSGFEFG